MNDVIPFTFDDRPVRMIDRDGLPWFSLNDVCAILGIANPRDAAGRLDDDEKDVVIVDTLGGPQESTAINESGLYKLILRSRKPEAKRFSKWVTSEVLPSIRRTGSYGAPAQPILPRDPRQLIAYLQQQAGDMVALQDANAAIAPKAEAYDRIADAAGGMTLTEASKVLKSQRASLIALLQNLKWIFRTGNDGRWQGYADKIEAGYLTHRITKIRSPRDGVEKAVSSVLVTPKGMARLAVILNDRAA